MYINKEWFKLPAVLLFLLCSCSSGTALEGNYSSNNGYYNLQLNKDSTFTYQYKFQYSYEYSQGTWRHVGKNKIVLNSHFRNKDIPLRIQELSADDFGKGNFFFININMPEDKRNYYRCMAFVNDSLYVDKSFDSIRYISIASPVKSIFFKLSADVRIPARFLDTLTTDKFLPKSDMENKSKIDIVFNDSLFNYKVFNGDIIRITKKRFKILQSKGRPVVNN